MPTQTAEQYYSLNAGGGQGGKNTNTKKKEMGSYEKHLQKTKNYQVILKKEIMLKNLAISQLIMLLKIKLIKLTAKALPTGLFPLKKLILLKKIV